MDLNLVQIEASDVADQAVSDPKLEVTHATVGAPVAAEAGLGQRRWVRAEGAFECNFSVQVRVDRPALDLSMLGSTAPHDLPGDTARYLMPSRYCPSDRFQMAAAADFGHLAGGATIMVMREWVKRAIDYVAGSSDAQTGALDTYVQRQGVCRDFAHVMIALARRATMPARFASVYAPGVEPQDFHAVAVVFLDGTWHLVDATGKAPANTLARIGVGLDAAKNAFLTAFGAITFGAITLLRQTVTVENAT